MNGEIQMKTVTTDLSLWSLFSRKSNPRPGLRRPSAGVTQGDLVALAGLFPGRINHIFSLSGLGR